MQYSFFFYLIVCFRLSRNYLYFKQIRFSKSLIFTKLQTQGAQNTFSTFNFGKRSVKKFL